MDAVWKLGARSLPLDRPRIMAILNLTPDSFYDGGALADVGAAVRRGVECVAQGADMLDIGGESTRPGAERIDTREQVGRIVPVIAAIRRELPDTPISVDTTRSGVAQAALDAGADAVNDVSGGTEDAAMLDLVARRGCGLVLMHRLTTPERDSYSDEYERPPAYDDVVGTVRSFLVGQMARAARAGIDADRVLVDPGLGFGKSIEQNLELIARTGELKGIGVGVLSGISRKSFTGTDGSGPADRLARTLELSVRHLRAGARVFRVHDAAEHAAVLRPSGTHAGWGVS